MKCWRWLAGVVTEVFLPLRARFDSGPSGDRAILVAVEVDFRTFLTGDASLVADPEGFSGCASDRRSRALRG